MKAAIQLLLRGYKRWISPMLPHACRFVPTCSEYAMEAVERHGVIRGTRLAVTRLLRCNPFAGAGYDPVPLSSADLDGCDGIGEAPLGITREPISRWN